MLMPLTSKRPPKTMAKGSESSPRKRTIGNALSALFMMKPGLLHCDGAAHRRAVNPAVVMESAGCAERVSEGLAPCQGAAVHTADVDEGYGVVRRILVSPGDRRTHGHSQGRGVEGDVLHNRAGRPALG